MLQFTSQQIYMVKLPRVCKSWKSHGKSRPAIIPVSPLVRPPEANVPVVTEEIPQANYANAINISLLIFSPHSINVK